MSLIKYNHSLSPLLDNFDDLFSVFDSLDPMLRPRQSISGPRANVENLEDKHVIEVATPGSSKEDLLVDVNDGRLSISYQEGDADPKGAFSFQRSFKRSWTLPKGVDLDGVGAEYNNGVLTVTVPKIIPEAPANRQIVVN